MQKRKLVCALVIAFGCIIAFNPNKTNATTYDSLNEEIDAYLKSDKGKDILAIHTDIDGKPLSYTYTVSNSTQLVTVTYSDGYQTSFRYNPSKVNDNTIVAKDTIDVNGYPVPKYIIESDDSALNARERYMKYNGDPSSFDYAMTPGNTDSIPSIIDGNGNAVSMNGKRQCNCWIDGKYYNSEGYNVTGWQNIKSNWYYFDADGYVQKGWKYLNGSWYFLENDGQMTTGWEYINKKWYFFDGNGKMQKGWLYHGNNVWYYLNDDGSMTIGWVKDKGKWYYMNGNGTMHTAWLKHDNKWYYLNPNNGAMYTGWLKSHGKWYYLNPKNGAMLENNFTLKGVHYRVASDGSCSW